MKKLILSLVYIMICFIGFAQTKKADSTKQTASTLNTNTALVQEKVWPINYTAARKDSVIVRLRPRSRTRIKL